MVILTHQCYRIPTIDISARLLLGFPAPRGNVTQQYFQGGTHLRSHNSVNGENKGSEIV